MLFGLYAPNCSRFFVMIIFWIAKCYCCRNIWRATAKSGKIKKMLIIVKCRKAAKSGPVPCSRSFLLFLFTPDLTAWCKENKNETFDTNFIKGTIYFEKKSLSLLKLCVNGWSLFFQNWFKFFKSSISNAEHTLTLVCLINVQGGKWVKIE